MGSHRREEAHQLADVKARLPKAMMRKFPVSLLGVSLVMVAALAGVVYGSSSNTLIIEDVERTNVEFIDAGTNDPPGNIDPGYNKDVADCTAQVVSDQVVEVVLTNAYPSYTCAFTVVARNGGPVPTRLGPLTFQVPPELTLTEIGGGTDTLVDPGDEHIEDFTVHVEQEAQERFTYTFRIHKGISLPTPTPTPTLTPTPTPTPTLLVTPVVLPTVVPPTPTPTAPPTETPTVAPATATPGVLPPTGGAGATPLSKVWPALAFMAGAMVFMLAGMGTAVWALLYGRSVRRSGHQLR
jgi:hypothetical protein